jgi:hypothetical protein
MKRPQQQIVNDAGERQMRSIFEPLGWAVRKCEKDNGIDFDIEVFDNFKSAGVFFKVQLKSSEGTRYSTSKEFLSQQLEIPNAEYLCREVRLPVVLIHADVKDQRTLRYAPRLMSHELQAIIARKTRNSITVRMPAANELPLSNIQRSGRRKKTNDTWNIWKSFKRKSLERECPMPKGTHDRTQNPLRSD